MATKAKVSVTPIEEKVMSEVRDETPVNGEDTDDVDTGNEENGWLNFTLSSSSPDYDIVCKLDPTGLDGIDVRSFVKLAGKAYKHIMSNERSSAGKARSVEKFPDRELFERNWALSKRKTVISGEYAEGGRNVGPRLSPFDKELRRLIIAKKLMPLWKDPKPFPTAGKAMIGDKSLDQWVKYVAEKPEYASLHDEARANVAELVAAREAAKATPATANPFASL